MRWTKKMLVMILIFVITSPGQVAHAMSFVPDVIHHYYDHNSNQHSMGIFEFIGEHVKEVLHNKSTIHDNEKCPTNHDSHVVNLTYFFESNEVNAFDLNHSFHFISKKTPLPPYQFSFSEFQSKIWQPPKLS